MPLSVQCVVKFTLDLIVKVKVKCSENSRRVHGDHPNLPIFPFEFERLRRHDEQGCQTRWGVWIFFIIIFYCFLLPVQRPKCTYCDLWVAFFAFVSPLGVKYTRLCECPKSIRSCVFLARYAEQPWLSDRRASHKNGHKSSKNAAAAAARTWTKVNRLLCLPKETSSVASLYDFRRMGLSFWLWVLLSPCSDFAEFGSILNNAPLKSRAYPSYLGALQQPHSCITYGIWFESNSVLNYFGTKEQHYNVEKN